MTFWPTEVVVPGGGQPESRTARASSLGAEAGLVSWNMHKDDKSSAEPPSNLVQDPGGCVRFIDHEPRNLQASALSEENRASGSGTTALQSLRLYLPDDHPPVIAFLHRGEHLVPVPCRTLRNVRGSFVIEEDRQRLATLHLCESKFRLHIV